MKLFRHGPAGQEQPGLIGADGIARSLAGHVEDIGPESALTRGVARGSPGLIRTGCRRSILAHDLARL